MWLQRTRKCSTHLQRRHSSWEAGNRTTRRIPAKCQMRTSEARRTTDDVNEAVVPPLSDTIPEEVVLLPGPPTFQLFGLSDRGVAPYKALHSTRAGIRLSKWRGVKPCGENKHGTFATNPPCAGGHQSFRIAQKKQQAPNSSRGVCQSRYPRKNSSQMHLYHDLSSPQQRKTQESFPSLQVCASGVCTG